MSGELHCEMVKWLLSLLYVFLILRYLISFMLLFKGAAHRHYNNGVPIKLVFHGETVSDRDRNKRTKPNNPTLADVMYSAVSAMQCVMNGESFEDFAANLGYDENSRKAEKCYRGCIDEYKGLVRLAGRDGLDQLCELFQDY